MNNMDRTRQDQTAEQCARSERTRALHAKVFPEPQSEVPPMGQPFVWNRLKLQDALKFVTPPPPPELPAWLETVSEAKTLRRIVGKQLGIYSEDPKTQKLFEEAKRLRGLVEEVAALPDAKTLFERGQENYRNKSFGWQPAEEENEE